MTIIDGICDEKFAGVRAAFEASFAEGDGASVCITKDGETVVDLWGGDAAKARPWTRDTIVNVYSTTKTMTALVALMLADRGALDFDAPVKRYWPQFGKPDIKVSHLMSHSSGLCGWKETVTKQDLYDWEKMTALLAAQAPFWEPGTACGYHALTQGYLVGEVVRRIAGETVGTFFRKEVAEPLGADFHIGLPASEDHRVAELIAPPEAAFSNPDRSALQANIATNPPIDVGETRTRAWRGAEIPAAGGTGNARSVASVHRILANGGVAGGKRFLSEAGCRKALAPQIEGTDLVLGIPVRYGMGFGLPGGMLPLPGANSCFWGGYGGSLAIIDMDARTSFAYAMTRMIATTTGDMRAFTLASAMWQALA